MNAAEAAQKAQNQTKRDSAKADCEAESAAKKAAATTKRLADDALDIAYKTQQDLLKCSKKWGDIDVSKSLPRTRRV